MSVQSDAAIRLTGVDKDGLPEQAGEHGADNAAVDVTMDGVVEREPGRTGYNKYWESNAAIDEIPTGSVPPVDLAKAEPVSGNRGDEDDLPQPLRVVGPPADFDWRKLKPRRYGRSLPPLDPMERQTLKASMESRGFLGRILIDDLLNIIDGNHRWDICMETGIAPVVEVIQGFSKNKKRREWEKEELALSCNLDRRQLNKEDAAQVFEARLDNWLDKRREDKSLTQERIAAELGVSVSTVSARERFKHDSDGGTASKPDARRKYDDELKREAVRLVKEGMPKADVARTLLMHPKAVDRAEKEEKRRESGKTAATQTTEPLADSDGVPELHRWAPEQLGQDTQAYIDRLKARTAEIRKDIEAVSDIDEMTNHSVYFSVGQAFTNFGLRNTLSGGNEIDVEDAAPSGDSSPNKAGQEPDTILLGTVMATERDEVFVALCVGGGGVIDNRDDCLDRHAPLKVDEVVRVRAEGFDWKRGLWKLQPLARQTVAPAPGAIAGSHRDDRCSPDKKLAGRKAGPKEFRA